MEKYYNMGYKGDYVRMMTQMDKKTFEELNIPFNYKERYEINELIFEECEYDARYADERD